MTGARKTYPPRASGQAMASDQTTLGAFAPVEHDRRDELDDDPTPRGTVRAVLGAAMERVPLAMLYLNNGGSPLRVLDIGAGYGCWASEMRRLAAEQGWPVHITGVEVNEDRRGHLRKWCDEVVIADWREHIGALALLREMESWVGDRGPGYDLVIGNPPFAHLLADGKDTDHRPPETTMVPTLLKHAPAVLLLHTQQALLKSECGRAVQRLCPPTAAWQVPGSVAFRGGGAADSRCYEATLWMRGHSGSCSRYLLPELAAKDRRWSVPPGSEGIDEARALGLPLAPGYGEP